MKTRINRRMVLRGALAGAAVSMGLPLLEVFLNDTGSALAGGAPLPRRFGIFFWGNGNLPDRWVPSGSGPTWEPSPQLAPLAALKENITVVSGMKVYTGNAVPHGSGPAGIFSGSPLLAGIETNNFSAPSIDQVIASAVGGDTRFRSLELAVQRSSDTMSINGPHSMNPAEFSPKALFDRLFGDEFTLPGSEPKLDPRLALRRSVLDAVADDAKRLQSRLGKADKIRLEQHFDGVRGLEQRLKKFEENPPSLASCAYPPTPEADYPDIDGRPQLSAVSRIMSDIAAMALACDQTRVLSLWFSRPVSNLLFPKATAGHHQLTHDEPGEQPQVFEILLYVMTELAYFLSALKAVPEGDGTLLDNCAMLCTTDCGYAKAHSVEEYPILIAGGAGGALKQGIHYRSVASENTSKVLLTLARAMGLTLSEFGAEGGHVTDGLSAIEV
jgi:hypothetical protein